MYKLDIKRNKIHIIGDVSNIDTSHLINWNPHGSLQSGSFDKNIDSIDFLCNQVSCKGSEQLKQWYIEQKKIRKKTLKILKGNWCLHDTQQLNKELKDYQLQAIAYFLETKRAIIGYSPGLGKSLIAINCIKAIKAKKVLIVCPSYLKFNWQDEINKWNNTIESVVINGTKEQRELQIQNYIHKTKNNYNIVNVIIVNYEQIRIKKSKDKNGKQINEINMHDVFTGKFDMVIWDEAHRLKTRDSQTTLGNFALSTDYRLMLTGTPVTKNPSEIWSLLHILDRKTFVSFWGFVKHFCHVTEGFRALDIGTLIKPKEYKRLLASYMIRKTKEDVANLPEKIFTEIKVMMGDKQEKIYKKAEKEYLKPTNDIIESDVERFIRLCQIAQNPLICEGTDVSIVKDTTIDILRDIEDSVIVGCTYIKMSESLKESIQKQFKNRKVYLINSKVSTKNRYKIVEDFKHDKTGILVTTIKCLSEGANLDMCDNMILGDIEWNCGTNEQFQNRIHRMTSTRVKNYYFITVKNTVNEYKFKKIETERIGSKKSLGDSDQKIIKFLMNEYKKR